MPSVPAWINLWERERERWVLPRLSIVLVFLLTSGACSKSPDGNGSSELRPKSVISSPSIALSPGSPTSPTPARTKEPPPDPNADEASEVLTRVFGKLVTMDEKSPPSFLVGDFNGDGSPDIAIVTKPGAEALAEINSELANWTLEDPHQNPISRTPAADQLAKPKPIKIGKGDLLLAIIHGVGPQGWRNHEARQTFLLRNVTGANATVQTADALRHSSSRLSLPVKGDAISEVVNGHRGLILWNGAKYSWAPLE